MLENINIRELSPIDLSVLIDYFAELTVPDRIVLLNDMNYILTRLQSDMGMNPIFISPFQDPILAKKIEDCTAVRSFRVNSGSELFSQGIKHLPQYNYVILNHIFPANGIKNPFVNYKIIDSKVDYQTIDIDKDIIKILNDLINSVRNNQFVNTYHGNYTVITQLLMKYVIKYKILAKIELCRLYYEITTGEKYNKYELNYIHPSAKMLLDFINNPSLNELKLVNVSFGNNKDIEKFLYGYLLSYHGIDLCELPFKGLSTMKSIERYCINTESGDIISTGTINYDEYQKYIGLTFSHCVNDTMNENVNFNISDKVKAAIISGIEGIKFCILESKIGERFLVKENDNIFLVFTENSVVKGIDIKRLSDNKENLFVEFVDLDLDSDYYIVMKEDG